MKPQNEGANFTAKHRETFAVNDGTNWISAAQVAQMLGISKRAVQAQCKRGLYHSRRVQTPQGEAWEIDAATVEGAANKPANDGPQTREPFTAKSREEGANFTANPKDAAPDFAGRYVEQLERENAFLRAQIEEGNRNAAELRAALRESLKAQPRQLGASQTASEHAQIKTVPETPRDTQAPVKSPGNETSATPKKEPRPLWKLVFGIR